MMGYAMNREEGLIANYIIETVHAIHPEYGLVAEDKGDYIKIYMPDGYGVDSAILAMVHYGPKSRYIKLKPWGLNKEQRKVLISTLDKKGMTKIESWEDVKKYEEYFVPIADYIWKTYKIKKYREQSKNRPKSELLGALGLYVDFSSSEVGISFGLKNDDNNS